MVVPTKTKNPVNADATHILSNMTMTLLPMPSHGSNNNGRSLLRFPSGCRHKVAKILGNEGPANLTSFYYHRPSDNAQGTFAVSNLNGEIGFDRRAESLPQNVVFTV